MLEIEESRLEAGARVAERYRLDHVLGEGGMGVVWDARDESSGEERALKFVRTDKCGDARSIARLLREARAASAVSHPNVARVFAVDELPEGTPFLVMERLHGETLGARLARVGKLPASDVASIGVAIAKGVLAAHALGIVHRDLKPENVFLLTDGGVKVIDFGIAKELRADEVTGLTNTGAMLGTLHYMAPEQVFGDVDVDERADVWALGVVLYECIAGQKPTEGTGSGQVLKAIMTRAFPPLTTAAPGTSEALSDLVARMLHRERDERPSLDEVVETLEGRTATSATPRTTLAPPSPRSRVLLVAGLVSVVGLGAALAMRALPAGDAKAAASASTSPPAPSLPSADMPVASVAATEPSASAAPTPSAKAGAGSRPSASATSGKTVGVHAPAPATSTSAAPAAPVPPSPAPSATEAPGLPPLATSRRS